MQSWIIVLIVLSTVFACWGFSIALRLISEFVARMRKALRSERKTKDLVFAFITMGLSFVGSLICAGSAIYIASLIHDLDDIDSFEANIVIAISGGIVGFSLMLMIWALIGDRARGRVRCPKCWYNMEGVIDPRCPECGKPIKSEKHLRKSRRMRWPIVLGVLGLSLSWHGFSSAKYVYQTDWLAVVPTWFLMLGWEHLPEDWILEDNSPYWATLDERLGYTDENDKAWVSEWRVRRFGKKLCKDLMTSEQARWDARRLTLIDSLGRKMTHRAIKTDEGSSSIWIGAPVDADELYKLCIQDQLIALLTLNPTDHQIKLIESSIDWMSYQLTPYSLINDWMRSEYESNSNREYGHEKTEYEIESHIESLHTEFRDQLLDPAFQALLNSESESIRISSIDLIANAGLIIESLDALLRVPPTSDRSVYMNAKFAIAFNSLHFSDGELYILFDRLRGMIEIEDFNHQTLAIDVFRATQKYLDYDLRSENEAYQQCYESVYGFALKTAPLLRDHDQEVVDDVFYQGMQILLQHDYMGQIAYPVVLNMLLEDPTQTPYLNMDYDTFGETHHIKQWIENFAQLANDPDPDIQAWLSENIPVQLGTEYDEQIDEIAEGLLDHPDSDIAAQARSVLRQRLANHLISPGDGSDSYDEYWDD